MRKRSPLRDAWENACSAGICSVSFNCFYSRLKRGLAVENALAYKANERESYRILNAIRNSDWMKKRQVDESTVYRRLRDNPKLTLKDACKVQPYSWPRESEILHGYKINKAIRGSYKAGQGILLDVTCFTCGMKLLKRSRYLGISCRHKANLS